MDKLSEFLNAQEEHRSNLIEYLTEPELKVNHSSALDWYGEMILEKNTYNGEIRKYSTILFSGIKSRKQALHILDGFSDFLKAFKKMNNLIKEEGCESILFRCYHNVVRVVISSQNAQRGVSPFS